MILILHFKFDQSKHLKQHQISVLKGVTKINVLISIAKARNMQDLKLDISWLETDFKVTNTFNINLNIEIQLEIHKNK